MKFVFSDELKAYIKEKRKDALAVTVADTSNSDLNVEELYIRLLSRKDAEFLKSKRNYHSFPSEVCEVLLPNYRLEYNPEVYFYLKKFLFFRIVKSKGIRF